MKDGSTRFAILGILSFRPMSGYEIKQAYEQGMVNFWSISYGQIYPLLRDLSKEGLIAPAGRAGKRDQQQYGLTAKGRAELARWMELEPAEPPRRNELLLKMFFAAPGDAALLRDHLEAFRETERRRLGAYAGIDRWLDAEHARNPRKKFWAMTLDFGREMAKARLAWVDRALKALPKEKAT